MRTRSVLAALLLLLPVTSAQSQLQPRRAPSPDSMAKADALGQCMVSRTNGTDRTEVAAWMLAGLASAPQLANVARVEPGRKTAADQAMARLFVRLMTVDCAPQARELFATRDQRAIEAAGGALGRIAMQELLSNPQALAALEAYTAHIDIDALDSVMP